MHILINEQKNRNIKFHNIIGNSRVNFWNSVIDRINRQFDITYTGQQCKTKFQNLIREHTISELLCIICHISNYTINLSIFY